MSKFHHEGLAGGQRDSAPSALAWNTVMPALGLALILGAPLVAAMAIAAVAWIAIDAVLAR